METLIAEKWTYEDMLANLPADSCYELINNELYEMPAPNTEHQRIALKLVNKLFLFVENKNIGEAFITPYDVRLDYDNVIQPDILFIKNANLVNVTEKCFVGVPDLVVEIISPKSVYRDQVEKKNLYERFGVQEYWVIDPANQVIEVMYLEKSEYVLKDYLVEKGIVKSVFLNGFEVKGEEIFSIKT